MTATHPISRVQVRTVLLSLAALWGCYFIVATLRGALMGFDFVWPIISRRLAICIVSMLVMAAVWPLLQLLERKSGGIRLAIVLAGALPLSLALSIINDVIFSDLDGHAITETKDKSATIKTGNVTITRDGDGQILISTRDAGDILSDVPNYRGSGINRQSDTASEAAPDTDDTESEQSSSGSIVTIQTSKSASESKPMAPDGASGGTWRWANIVDSAFGRYFLVLAWAALYFALAKAEEARAAERREGEYRRAAAVAELRSLRYQVNPHFLFNTLNSLSALVMTGRQDDAEEMIQTLSTFYRRTLSGDTNLDITLAEEVELQRLYFAIEAVRFPQRLKTQIDVDDGVRNALVPGMILQPLVENSVKYAVAATQRPVTITIRARSEGGRLVIVVQDDGPGSDIGLEIGGKVDGFGIGLTNVRDRLRARYGPPATIEYGKRDSGGFETTLHLPLEVGSV